MALALTVCWTSGRVWETTNNAVEGGTSGVNFPCFLISELIFFGNLNQFPFFVDLAANDATNLSNTLHLEENVKDPTDYRI